MGAARYAFNLESLIVITNLAVYSLSFYVAFENTSELHTIDGTPSPDAVRSCTQWRISALTMSLAWINLLFHMRLINTIGRYVILFQEILVSFFTVFLIILILLIGFGLSFHMLLSHRDNFAEPEDALLKTMMMMSGEIEYGEMFFKDKPPLGWDQDWDQGPEHVPFPVVTYTIFIAFFFLVCLVALNVFVGLAVDDTRKFLEKAQIRKLTMRLKFILELENQMVVKPFIEILVKQIMGKKSYLKNRIEKGSKFEKKLTEDLPPSSFENRIFERMVKKEKSEKEIEETEQEKEETKQLLRNVKRKFSMTLTRLDSTSNKSPGGSKKVTTEG